MSVDILENTQNMSSSYMEAQIIPLGKPRMTQRDRWKKRPVVTRYHEYADRLREKADKQNFLLGPKLEIQFWMPMPQSWSKKKRLEHLLKPHKQRPDLDNLIKAVQDILLKEDSAVWYVTATKRWSEEGKLVIFNLK